MTHPEVIEGTWEELAAYAEVLKGLRLRLIVLPTTAETADSVPNEPRLRETVARLFAEADCIERRQAHLEAIHIKRPLARSSPRSIGKWG